MLSRTHQDRRAYSIFVVDRGDDLNAIRSLLANRGFAVRAFANGEPAIRRALASPPSMFILETAIPQSDGLELCRRIRRTPGLSLIPVLFVSHRSQEADKVAGLEAGADDYMVKPFGEREMIARVMANLRRCYELSQPVLIRFDEIEINSEAMTLTVNRSPVELSLREFRLLEYFVCNPGRTFSRDHLLKIIRSRSGVVKPRLVDVYIKRIRRTIEPDEENPTYLRTVRGLGYCFHLPATTSGPLRP